MIRRIIDNWFQIAFALYMILWLYLAMMVLLILVESEPKFNADNNATVTSDLFIMEEDRNLIKSCKKLQN